jgi:hypothetical protein
LKKVIDMNQKQKILNVLKEGRELTAKQIAAQFQDRKSVV